MFCEKGVLGNFRKFTGKHLCQSLFFNKVAGLRAATLLEKKLWRRSFPENFVTFLRTPFLTEHLCGCSETYHNSYANQFISHFLTWTREILFTVYLPWPMVLAVCYINNKNKLSTSDVYTTTIILSFLLSSRVHVKRRCYQQLGQW